MESDTTYFKKAARLAHEAYEEIMDNLALYMTTLFTIVLQCAVDYIAIAVGNYRK